jgi:hypothetical protein
MVQQRRGVGVQVTVHTPSSVTDPYAPEPSNVAPVRIRCTFLDGRVFDLQETDRVMAPWTALRIVGSIFAYKGNDATGRRLYREVPVVDLTNRLPVESDQR